MTWSLALALMLTPFYVGAVCWLARPLQRYIARTAPRWLRSILLFSWRV